MAPAARLSNSNLEPALQGWALSSVTFWSGYAPTARSRYTTLAISIDLKDPERSVRAVRPVPSHCMALCKACQTSPQGGESCGSRSRARFYNQPLSYSNARAHRAQLSCVDHPGPTSMAAVMMLTSSWSISTSSTVGLASELHVRGRGDRERGRLATKISTIHAQSLALQLHLMGRRRPSKCATVKRSLPKADAAEGPTL